jgi:RNA polymerase sigma-70 factor, ECF subfamily
MFEGPTKKHGAGMIPQALAQRAADDAELTRGIAQRDEHAFEALMRRHNRMLYRLARSILKDEAEAEDAVQEAYLAAYCNIGSFRGGAALSTWLARILINEAYARLRKRKHAGVVVAFDPNERNEQGIGEGDMSDHTTEPPEAAAMRSELRRLLERKIDELPAQFRTVFMLRDVEELSVDETAECLDIPAATVRTRAFRARALLRESLAREIDVATADAFEFAGERCDRIVATVLRRLLSGGWLPKEIGNSNRYGPESRREPSLHPHRRTINEIIEPHCRERVALCRQRSLCASSGTCRSRPHRCTDRPHRGNRQPSRHRRRQAG